MADKKTKKRFALPLGSKLVLTCSCAEVEIVFEGEDTHIIVKPLSPDNVLNVVPFQAEELARLLVQASRLAQGLPGDA
jgi:hypothetical protein